MATARPKRSSLEPAWTARPWNVAWVSKPLPAQGVAGLGGLGVDGAPGPDERLGVLGDRGDPHADADPHEAARDAAGHDDELRRVVGGDLDVVPGRDGDAGTGVGEGVKLHDDHRHGTGDADLTAGSTEGHGDHGVLGIRRDDDVPGGVHRRRLVDVGIGVQGDESDCGTDADADRSTGGGGRDEQVVEGVAGGYQHRLIGVGARRGVDLGELAHEGGGVVGEDVDGPAHAHRHLSRDRRADAHAEQVVAVGSRDRHPGEAAHGGRRHVVGAQGLAGVP
jgi:hypothetical protein